jgi:hypothetical protein
MSEYIRSYEGLGQQAYARSYEGLGQQAYTRSYEGLGRQGFTRSYDGLGWVNSPGSTDQISGGRNVCFRNDEEQFASSRGCRPAYGMGCRKPDGTVSRYPCCPSDRTKTLWECPAAWETTPGAPAGTTTASSSQVRQLQQTMLNAGCSLPRFGADGRWGSETASALQCYAGLVGWASISRRFPWAAARVGQRTTPSNGAVATTNGNGAPLDVARAGVLPFAMPGILGEWWFWIAALGIGGLGVAGYLQMKKKEEKEEYLYGGGSI